MRPPTARGEFGWPSRDWLKIVDRPAFTGSRIAGAAPGGGRAGRRALLLRVDRVAEDPGGLERGPAEPDDAQAARLEAGRAAGGERLVELDGADRPS